VGRDHVDLRIVAVCKEHAIWDARLRVGDQIRKAVLEPLA